ncbi:MAG: phosphoserine transaminase [Actinomycetaceae bacterium]|nr:phosphoserine transaminase [Actinomycetaceae bacterium]
MSIEFQIPADLLPDDGRFGSGPSKVRVGQTDEISRRNTPNGRHLIVGTSHRQAPVKDVVADIRAMIIELFAAPDGYEVALGNGGSTAFWAIAATSLIQHRSAHAAFGEFGQKFVDEAARAPHLEAPVLFSAEAGQLATVQPTDGVDAYAWPQHETSTGVLSPVKRITTDALMLVDATSIAGGIEVDIAQTDAYYFAPQKCFGSDGGLWLAFLSPAAQERARELHEATDRWMPQILDLSIALTNSVKNQTLNTPALMTLLSLRNQLRWMLDIGGLEACAARSRASTDAIYQWAENREFAMPFVANPTYRSPVVATIDFEGVDASRIASILRDNGIVDVEPYRKLGRNQLRIAAFPAVETSDVEKLLTSIDWVVDALRSVV